MTKKGIVSEKEKSRLLQLKIKLLKSKSCIMPNIMIFRVFRINFTNKASEEGYLKTWLKLLL